MKVLFRSLFFLGYLLTMSSFSSPDTHPLHLSVCEVHYRDASQTVEVSMKFFWDDFGDALSEYSQTDIDLSREELPDNLNEIISAYLHQHCYLGTQDEAIPLRLLGTEIEGQAIWCYLSGTVPHPTRHIAICNKSMMSHFSDQKNITHIYQEHTKVCSYLFDSQSTAIEHCQW